MYSTYKNIKKKKYYFTIGYNLITNHRLNKEYKLNNKSNFKILLVLNYFVKLLSNNYTSILLISEIKQYQKYLVIPSIFNRAIFP